MRFFSKYLGEQAALHWHQVYRLPANSAERLTPPISHRDHPFWKPQFPLFLARHQEEQQGRQASEAIKQRLLREDPREALRQQIVDELRTEALTIEREIRLTEIRLAGENRSFAEGLLRVEETYRSRRAALESEVRAGTR